MKTSKRKLLVVQTGAAPPGIHARHGDFPDWFRRALGLPGERIDCIRVHQDEVLPDPRRFAAAVVTGSAAMVSDRSSWSERTAAWLRDAAAKDLPLLGVCYGHQLLAHAYGGHVDYNPRGREIGSVEITMLPAAAKDPLFGAMPERFDAHATHVQSVLRPPAESVVLARSSLDDCHVIRFAPRVWGVQFHPEFNVRHMRAYLRERAEPVDSEGLDATALLRAVRCCTQARSLLRLFARLHAG